jgi:RNA polymerase sigma factor (sigma-70 family)
MAHYRNPAIRQLKEQQVRYAPRDVRIEQIEKAERLLEELDLARQDYRYQDLCFRITAYRPEMYPDLIVTGEDAAHDLRLFIEDLSDSANIKAENSVEQVLTVDDVSKRFKVSTKTVDRWRNRGLVSRRFMFGNRKRIGFLQSSIERFVARHAGDVQRGGQFTQMSDAERDEIIERARRLSRAGGCPAEISRRIARKTSRAVETIRYTLKNHDQQHPESAIFPNAPQALTEDVKKEIHRGFRRGMSVDRLARRYCRTKASIYRIVGEMRAKRLLDQPIECIYHASFEAPNADELILGQAPNYPDKRPAFKPPPGLPPYLAQLYSIPLLSKEQEAYYFRKMNYLKFRAARLRDQLDVSRAKSRVMDEIEHCLDEAVEVKNLLIRSNLRLVVSIAKKHVKPNGNFFEMVSDGNISLIRAIEKFDFSRGFKFSTYSTWAIMKNYARSIPAEHNQLDRYRTGTDELFLSSPDQRSDQFEQERVNHRQHEAIVRILDRLDERERNIIMFRFGLNQNTEPQTLEQLGGRFGVTKERIRQLEARALTKLRKIALEEKLDIPGV